MKPVKQRIYALYKGENFLGEGTISEISKKTGKSQNLLEYMTYPAYERKIKNKENNKRMIMVLLED